LKARELLLKDLTSVEPGETMADLVHTLQTSESSSIPVTDGENRLIGVISEHDVLTASLPKYMDLLSTTSFIPNLDQLSRGLAQIADEPIEHFMTREPLSVGLESEDLEVADLMLRRKLQALPVVDPEGRLVGVVRRVDLLRHLMEPVE
jgi:CBS domain-containing protein